MSCFSNVNVSVNKVVIMWSAGLLFDLFLLFKDAYLHNSNLDYIIKKVVILIKELNNEMA